MGSSSLEKEEEEDGGKGEREMTRCTNETDEYSIHKHMCFPVYCCCRYRLGAQMNSLFFRLERKKERETDGTIFLNLIFSSLSFVLCK
mmetsp:Transcript_88398/g.129252  ORF Transcript_88398/g.129252 Transcript_88398/m.129252 type:complete len:88 (+) Transcript_88398:656-919(+)